MGNFSTGGQQTRSSIQEHRERTAAAIERVLEENKTAGVAILPCAVPDLLHADARSLRMLASALRQDAWDDRTVSADDTESDSDDMGWAPSAPVRVAALLDHLAELAPALGHTLDVSPAPIKAESLYETARVDARWQRVTMSELRALFCEQEGRGLQIYDSAGDLVARATSWRGEVVEIVDEDTLSRRISTAKSSKDDKKRIETLEARMKAWGDALVRAGYARPHLGPSDTVRLFESHVVGEHRVEVTPDLNAIINGAVHFFSRLAPRRVDFARSPVTDLEIQRLNASKKIEWRKACRAIEALPRRGPIWRTHSLPDSTAMLVARADQKGEKAPGADALLARNFEESQVLGHGVRQLLLTGDNGLARTLCARHPAGVICLAYVDRPTIDERFYAPMISWPLMAGQSASAYSCLVELIDEALVCGVDEELTISDGVTVIRLRGHLAGEHQYPSDWTEPHVFVAGVEVSRAKPAEVAPQVVATREVPKRDNTWALREIHPPAGPRSGARVTLSQAAEALTLAAANPNLQRSDLGGSPHAREEMWSFLRSIYVVGADGGSGPSHQKLAESFARSDMEALRDIVAAFSPLNRLLESRDDSIDPDNRTQSAAANLGVGFGLLSRIGNTVFFGNSSLAPGELSQWLRNLLTAERPIGDVVQHALEDLAVSPIRFEEILEKVIIDAEWTGTRGGGAMPHPLDSDVVRFSAERVLGVHSLQAGSLLGLRSLARRA